MASLGTYLKALLGISAYQPAETSGYLQLGSGEVDDIRRHMGGNLQPQIQTKLRWYLADLEAAQASADAGFLEPVAMLHRAMRRDGTISGLLSTRAGGLIRLPNTFYGDEEICANLKRKNGTRSVFDEMVPPSELQALEEDGINLGVAVGEIVPVPGRNYGVLVRLDPQYLRYIWVENRWYFRSVAGLLPITPGDGRWVLHVPGPRIAPWQAGLWPALGRAYINKEHSINHRSNYSRTLANPARLAYAPSGASEPQRIGFFKKLLAWGMNTVLELPPGYEAKLLESNGRGIDIFQQEIDTCDNEIMVALAGQVVTTTGGTGFANADIHKTIREDLVKRDAESLSYTINTQILPKYVADNFGASAVRNRAVWLEWDTSTPKELEAQSRTLLTVTQAMAQLATLFAGGNRQVNWDELATRFAVPLLASGDGPAQVKAPAAEAPAPKRLEAA